RTSTRLQVHGILSEHIGHPATLAVLKSRRSEPDTINVPREITQPPTIDAKILENNIAYVKIPYLAPGKTAEVRRQLDALLKKGATNVVLDLRYTAGGVDKEAVQLANL